MVDEKSLKKQVATANSTPGTISSEQRTMQMMVNGNSSNINRQKSLGNTPGVNESMDNVNLSDTEGVTSSQPHQIRGKHFSKRYLFSLSFINTYITNHVSISLISNLTLSS